MINSQTIQVDNSTDGSTISSYSPLSLTLCTSGFTPLNKIWKIECDFGNDLQSTEELIPLLDQPTGTFILDESGDPRNKLLTTSYFFDDTAQKIYNIKIQFYEIGISTPEEVNFTISLTLPSLETILGDSTNFNLVGSRMFGVTDRLLYMFESQSPNYLLPVLLEF